MVQIPMALEVRISSTFIDFSQYDCRLMWQDRYWNGESGFVCFPQGCLWYVLHQDTNSFGHHRIRLLTSCHHDKIFGKMCKKFISWHCQNRKRSVRKWHLTDLFFCPSSYMSLFFLPKSYIRSFIKWCTIHNSLGWRTWTKHTTWDSISNSNVMIWKIGHFSFDCFRFRSGSKQMQFENSDHSLIIIGIIMLTELSPLFEGFSICIEIFNCIRPNNWNKVKGTIVPKITKTRFLMQFYTHTSHTTCTYFLTIYQDQYVVALNVD